jgi:RNA repair, ligase-Pnkp-associating, region of Hen1
MRVNLTENDGVDSIANGACMLSGVFYTHAAEDRCTACLLLDVDSVGAVRGKRPEEGQIDQYVNDRASSLLAGAGLRQPEALLRR